MKKHPSLLLLAIPLFIEFLLQMIMGTVDTLMLSRYSDDAVASVGVANQILQLALVTFGFVGTGTLILMSQRLGAGDEKGATLIAKWSVWANTLFGLLIGGLIVWCGEPLLLWMGLEPTLLPNAKIYLVGVGAFLFLQSIMTTYGSILRSYGYATDTMWVAFLMNILNIIGNYIAIFGFGPIEPSGIAGVAVATIISRVIGVFATLYLYHRHIQKPLGLFKRSPLTFQPLKDVLAIGLPSAGEYLSYTLSQLVITSMVATLGGDALTTRIYALTFMNFTFLFAMAISSAAKIQVGHLIGAGETNRAHKQGMKAMWISTTVALGVAVMVWGISPYTLPFFTADKGILSGTVTLLLIAIILEPGRAMNLVFISTLRATGDPIHPMIIGSLSMWGLSVPLSYALGIHWTYGLAGVWVAMSLDEWVRGLLMWRRWNQRRFIEKNLPD